MSAITNAICQSHNLYDIEQALELLVEAAEERPNDPGLQEAVGEYLDAALEKRDNIARFLGHLERQQDFARLEIQRLKDRQERLVALQHRIESFVIRFMQSKGIRKLEGKTSSLCLRVCPPSVQILDQAAIPAEYLVLKHETIPDKKRIKMALEAGHDVPGTDLQIGKETLMRK